MPNPSAIAPAADQRAAPFDAQELDQLFAVCAGFKRIALAVSGGPDSLALMHLCHAWGMAPGGPKPSFVVLTVNHGLRAAATGEVRQVAAAAARLGLDCHILTREAPASSASMLEIARADRYRLLCDAARAAGADAIVTGHTADDQAETLLMRLARGSGVDGLSAMAAVSCLDDLALVRPLLSVPKVRLLSFLKARQIAFIDDPSNTDPTFERPRLRAPGTTLAGAGLTRDALVRSARRLGRARAALEAVSQAANRQLAVLHPEGWVSLARPGFDTLPEEIRVRLLGYWLRLMGAATEHQRMAGVERIIAALASQPRHTATLAGCLIIAGPDVIDISREPGRNGLPQVPLEPGGSVLWDRRFTVRLPASARPGILIRPAKPADLTAEQKKLRLGLNVSQHIMETTPAAFRGNSLIACPVIGIMTEPIVFELALPDPSAGQANAVPHLTDE